MHGILSVERDEREPLGADGTCGGGQCSHPQPGEAAGPRSLQTQPGGDSQWLGHRCEPAARRGEGAVSYTGPTVDQPFPDDSSSIAAQDRSVLKFVVLAGIAFYRGCLSPAIPSSCRFYPTCSAYAQEAVSEWGVRQGLWMALKRLGRCRPGGSYGYDPVPKLH